jgi:hypothetical protein
VCVGKKQDLIETMAAGIEVREVPSDRRPWIQSYGTVDCGYEMTRMAWPRLKHCFSVRRNKESIDKGIAGPPDRVVVGHHRYPTKLLTQSPVDLLVVERGHQKHPTTGYQREPWETLIRTTGLAKRPKVVLESWPSSAEFWSRGPVCKASLTKWADVGYTSRCKLVNATRVGGAITQSRLMVARVQDEFAQQWRWPSEEASAAMARPMSNLLTPPGLVKTKHHQGSKADASDARTEPMPTQPGAWILTERGIRRLQLDEIGRGLGLPKSGSKEAVPGILTRTTSVFHWEYLSELLTEQDTKSMKTPKRPRIKVHPGEDPIPGEPMVPFSWRPPDLSPEGDWYRQRLASLSIAIQECPNPAQAWKDGQEILRIHRGNYDKGALDWPSRG